jgi:uncharacterized protein YutE (UPF0331/DUF86 family)
MRIKDKIDEIESYLNELETIIPSSFEEYVDNFEKKAACERYFEKIIEAVVDLTFLIIKDKKLKVPEEDKEAFDVLVGAKLISSDLATKLKYAKGMRNIIAHEYGKVDDEIVFEAITSELVADVKDLIKTIK